MPDLKSLVIAGKEFAFNLNPLECLCTTDNIKLHITVDFENFQRLI